MKKIYILIIATLFSTMAIAQTPKADQLFDNWEYFRAAKLYEIEAAKHPSADVYFKLGECYRKMNWYKEAKVAYDKVNEAGVYSKPEFYLNYGQILKNNGNYDQAKVAFDKYAELMPSDPKGKFFSASIDTVTEDHKWDEPITINNVTTLNSKNADLYPVFYKDGVIFSTNRKTAGHDKIYGWTGANFLDLYYAKKDSDDTKFVNVAPFDGEKINKMYHDGPACFSKNFDTIYITRVEKYLKGEDKKTLKIERNKIFILTMKDGNWTKEVPFFLNSDLYSVANPFLAPDGSRLYFVSDMLGGYGETDIYYCNREGTGWGNPINMGPNINTFNREKYPNMDAEGNFYFSSDGYQGFGGMDICVALNKNGTFEKAIPMKYPFNSFTNDFGMVFLKDGKSGYFSSNRFEGGQGDDDIYYFDLLRDSVPRDLMVPIYTIGYRPKSHEPEVRFLVNSPTNIQAGRRVIETFPLRNYIFFDLGSTEIPNRYELLRKDQVKDFKEENLEQFAPTIHSGRAKQQLIVYYNVLNILCDRMAKNPATTIKLVGSSEKGPEDGRAMAELVKKYMVNVFGINAKRISLEGNYKPKIPSEQPGGILELVLLREGDRRVSIESSSPALLIEFQSGPDAPLKPVEIFTVQEAPVDSYVTFNVEGGNEAFVSWTLEIRDETGSVQYFGPYSREKVSIPGKTILGTRPQGDYKVTMVGQTKNGNTVRKEASVHMVLWSQSLLAEGLRFSVIFEFDDSRSILIYEKFLTDIVTPKIPIDGKVIIHGYTDIIGEEAHNQTLSEARANDVRKIIEGALAKAGRNDVKLEVAGFGEDETLSPFENKFPEERFYNRTVIIDIIPNK
jgi:outer membrane protein OmpA-like peptidoglycan-associated protein